MQQEKRMKNTATSKNNEVLALPRADAARAIGVSTRSLDRLIQAGAIRTVPAFRRRLIPRDELQRFLNEGGHE